MTNVPVRILAALSGILLFLGAFSTPALAAPGGGHYCEARDGVVIVQRGRATCSADAGSYALAIGKNANSRADSGGTAIANGKGSTATAHIGHAEAIGKNSVARAVDWHSVAEVQGDNSQATAVNGGTAKVFGDFSEATAGGPGSEAFAEGDNSSASAINGCSITSGSGETLSCS